MLLWPSQWRCRKDGEGVSLGKDYTLKARTKDFTLRAKARTKDWNFVLKGKQGPRTKAKKNKAEYNANQPK